VLINRGMGHGYNTILESLLVWVRNPLGLFLSRSFLSYSIKPSPSGLGNTHQILAFDYIRSREQDQLDKIILARYQTNKLSRIVLYWERCFKPIRGTPLFSTGQRPLIQDDNPEAFVPWPSQISKRSEYGIGTSRLTIKPSYWCGTKIMSM